MSRATRKPPPGTPVSTGGTTTDKALYVVLARKYRPASFADLIGQGAMVKTLTSAFDSGRIAHGYMLTGVRGVGKTTTARIIARALNYEAPGVTAPTTDMPTLGVHCQAIIESRHVDVIEMDAASHTGIDDIREITEQVRYKPASARTKVFIIDEVHMLSKAAFNGLLKTLEEPPPHVHFIFATTEIRKVPVTILSRCQRFDLRRVEEATLSSYLGTVAEREGRELSPEALALIARCAEGSVRDGLSLLDRALATPDMTTAPAIRAMLGLADRTLVWQLAQHVFRGETQEALAALDTLHADGGDPAQILGDLSETVHLASRMKVAGAISRASHGEAEERAVRALADGVSLAALARAWQMLLKGLDEIARAPRAIAAAEMVVIRLCHVITMPPLSQLARPSAEESAKSAVSVPPGAPATPASASPTAPPAQPAAPPLPATLADLAALAGARRDIKLKTALEESVTLVSLQGAHLVLAVRDAAPADLSAHLARQLKAWTSRSWTVECLPYRRDDAAGQTLGDARRAQAASDAEAAQRHPAIQAALRHFPGATIEDVRRIARDGEGE